MILRSFRTDLYPVALRQFSCQSDIHKGCALSRRPSSCLAGFFFGCQRPDLSHENARILRRFTGKNLFPRILIQISIRKTAPMENLPQGVHIRRVHLDLTSLCIGVNIFPIYRCSNRDVFRRFQPAFDLERVRAGLAEGRDLLQQAQVFRAQPVARPPPVVGVRQAARLGAKSPVAASRAAAAIGSAQQPAHLALTGIAHTESPVDENFYFAWGHRPLRRRPRLLGRMTRGDPLRPMTGRGEGPDLLQGQLPGRHHPADSHLLDQIHRLRVVYRCLCGQMQRQVRHVPVQQAHQSHVLNDDRVCPDVIKIDPVFQSHRKLPVLQQGIESHVDFHIPFMGVGDGVTQPGQGEILRFSPGVEPAAAEINGIGAVVHSGAQLGQAARGRQKLWFFSLSVRMAAHLFSRSFHFSKTMAPVPAACSPAP